MWHVGRLNERSSVCRRYQVRDRSARQRPAYEGCRPARPGRRSWFRRACARTEWPDWKLCPDACPDSARRIQKICVCAGCDDLRSRGQRPCDARVACAIAFAVGSAGAYPRVVCAAVRWPASYKLLLREQPPRSLARAVSLPTLLCPKSRTRTNGACTRGCAQRDRVRQSSQSIQPSVQSTGLARAWVTNGSVWPWGLAMGLPAWSDSMVARGDSQSGIGCLTPFDMELPVHRRAHITNPQYREREPVSGGATNG